MKSGLFVCALVVLAYQVATCIGLVKVLGNCAREDIPITMDDCVEVTCIDQGDRHFNLSIVGCPLKDCAFVQRTDTGDDNSKIYPECCSPFKCI